MDPFATPTSVSSEKGVDYFSLPIDSTLTSDGTTTPMDPERPAPTHQKGKKRVGFSSVGPDIDPDEEQKLRSALRAHQTASDLNSELNSRRNSTDPMMGDRPQYKDGGSPTNRAGEMPNGLLSTLWRLHSLRAPGSSNTSLASTPASSPPASGTVTPSALFSGTKPLKQWWKPQSAPAGQGGVSRPYLGALVGSTSQIAMKSDLGQEVAERLKAGKHKRSKSSQLFPMPKWTRKQSQINQLARTAQEIKDRREYLLLLCRLLMEYGAPVHRLEEYLSKSAEVLAIDTQCIHLYGCMMISFDDRETRTAEVRMVRTSTSINFAKLSDVHEVYKEVVHNDLEIIDGHERLKKIEHKRPYYNKWILVVTQGVAAATLGPWAFGGK